MMPTVTALRPTRGALKVFIARSSRSGRSVFFAAVEAGWPVIAEVGRLGLGGFVPLPSVEAAGGGNDKQQESYDNRSDAHQYSFPVSMLAAAPSSKSFLSVACCRSSIAWRRPKTSPNMTVC